MPGGDDDGNRTELGRPPAPFGTEDTVAAPLVVSKAPTKPPPEPPALTAAASKGAPATPEDPSSSRSLPYLDRVRYHFIGEVGRGGLGRVFRARDLYLDRQVAVKELIDPDDAAQHRFVREALITARLQHPAIVPIYDAGQSGELGPFYAMKLVEGRSLADTLADTQTLEQRLALLPSVIAVADAMAYAHSQKIIHRDLKPQNVLVGGFGETVLIDWGLAKDLAVDEAQSTGPYRAAANATETLDGAVLGTPAFMAPEQATGGTDVDERADVYALGAMLYHLGAGVPPHSGKSVDEMLVKVVSGDVLPLAEREPRIPADLAAIVGKAMQHDPAKRYRTARELSEDLHKFQTGQFVGAKTYSLGERFTRWLRRNRRVVAVACAALLILVGYGVWSLQKIYAERQRAEDEAARAVAAAKEASTQRDAAIAQAMLVRARQYAATGHTAEELAVLRVLARAEAGESSRKLAINDGGLVWKSHQRLAMALGHEVGLALRSADGSRFVATEPGAIVVWDAATGKELARQPLDPKSTSAARFGKVAAISPTGRYAVLAVCTQPGDGCGIAIVGDESFVLRANTRLELRELATGRTFGEWTGTDRLQRKSLAFAVDDTAFAVRRGDTLALVDGAGVKHDLDVAGCDGVLAVAPNGANVAIGCKDHVRLAKLDGTTTQILKGLAAKTALTFISADRLLAIGDTMKLWDVAAGELRGEGKLPEATDPTAARDEGDDVDWSYFRPKPPPGTPIHKLKTRSVKTPQIRIGSTMSIVPRTSVLAPPPRMVASGAVVTIEGQDWQALSLQHDRLRYALVDNLVPGEPPERCLSRIGSERHAMIALDGGARLLVDEQELAAGLDVAPPEGYRHTTTGESPVRQLRPLLAAEADACLVWGTAAGARTVDAGEVAPTTRAIDDGSGGLVLVDDQASRITRSGMRTPIPSLDAPLESATGKYIATIDLDADRVAITATAIGAVVRSWKVPDPSVAIAPGAKWVAADVVEVNAPDAMLVSIDPAIPVRKREDNLDTDPRSRYGTRVSAAGVGVVRVADGVELARHAGAVEWAKILPDDSGSVLIEAGGTRYVVATNGQRVTLAASRQAIGPAALLDVVDGHLISRGTNDVSVWQLATGRSLTIPTGARDVAIANGQLWAVTGLRKPLLSRTSLDGRGKASETRLSIAGLPFLHVGKGLRVSPDGRRLTAEYAVTEGLLALGMWDAESGALLWVGPPTSRVVGDWVISAGRAFVPTFDVDALLHDTGSRSNLRVCHDDLRAVPVVPPPPPDSYWAPDASCAAATDPRR